MPLNTVAIDKSITYQDPCNMSRLNGLFNDAHRLPVGLGATLLEPNPCKDKTFCCGGGGANMWFTVSEKERISYLRLKQLLATKSSIIAVSCPYCMVMLEDAAKTIIGEEVNVKDISELVWTAIEPKG